jgi:predicted nucleotidyltransferase
MADDIIRWLITQLASHSPYIVLARLFGSIARGSTSPSDCDILIVSDAPIDSSEWHALRGRLKEVEAGFRYQFGLPLSITLMTPSERASLKSYVDTLTPCVDFLVRP